ncbi:right-handed parallel beta-helix repeat-containing protein [Paenibacillus allorhizosphaerae]|uniref:Alpha-1,3-galactosidase B n=1 Tax=Paenibacillus allorhizosphaerae TaxID=2849866 RepID=A0ABM8VMV8_9BACL|nr:right-handed parallel beta-helix repeat-containing protein [Paenibacillus allorhizosphaerae]CAG7650581.1 Alpha-1,3-galactosidase B [Paenibacillus allorhizosphaerae]
MNIDLNDFGLTAGREHDATLAVYRALKHCKEVERPTLVFPAGTYQFHPEKAVEGYYHITNHDQGGTRKIAFPLIGPEGLTIDGQGSEFIFHGRIIPFVLEHARNITLRNFSVDWERPMFEQGTVAETGEQSFVIRLREEAKYKVDAGRLYFTFGGREEPVWGLHDIDPNTMAHAYQSGDRISWSSFKKLRMEEIGPGLIRVAGGPRHMPKAGNIIVMRIGRREHPGLFLKDSANVQIDNVTVHHAPGMGLVAQRCTDIRLHRFDVRLKPGSGRAVTATADATHFTNCKGAIVLEDCLFENQLDDPLNVHGIYAKIAERLSDRSILVQLIHGMQKGVVIAEPHDEMNFIRSDSLTSYSSAEVVSADRLNADFTAITFDRPLPETMRIGDAVENKTWNADLTVRGCTVRANRARGFLITTPGKVLLEHNTISAPGAGIKISGDANLWYESGAVGDVTIRHNRFLACNYCFPDWGRAVIDIDPEIAEPEAYAESYHRNIRIEHNVFETFDIGIVYGHSVNGFVFRDNVIRRTSDYPMHKGMPFTIQLKAVKNSCISGNECPEDARTAFIGTEKVDISADHSAKVDGTNRIII